MLRTIWRWLVGEKYGWGLLGMLILRRLIDGPIFRSNGWLGFALGCAWFYLAFKCIDRVYEDGRASR